MFTLEIVAHMPYIYCAYIYDTLNSAILVILVFTLNLVHAKAHNYIHLQINKFAKVDNYKRILSHVKS